MAKAVLAIHRRSELLKVRTHTLHFTCPQSSDCYELGMHANSTQPAHQTVLLLTPRRCTSETQANPTGCSKPTKFHHTLVYITLGRENSQRSPHLHGCRTSTPSNRFAMFRTDNWHFTLKLGTASQKPVQSFETLTNLPDQCHPGELVESLTSGF